jgi:hypothetical protein
MLGEIGVGGEGDLAQWHVVGAQALAWNWRFDARCRARIMIAAAAHCPWDKVWSNLGLAMATLLLPSLLLRVATGNVWHSSRPAWLITFSC